MRSATPLTKSAERFNTLAPRMPVTVPVSGPFAVIVTWSANALNEVTVFPKASRAVSVFEPVNAEPLTCGLASAKPNDASAAGPTVTFAVPVIVPVTVSVAVTVCAPEVLSVTAVVKVWLPLSPATKV